MGWFLGGAGEVSEGLPYKGLIWMDNGDGDIVNCTIADNTVGTSADIDGFDRFDMVGKGSAGVVTDMGVYEGKEIWFVKDGAGGINNGYSWENAFSHLQDGLDVAAGGDEIWVATGTYYPDEDSVDSVDPAGLEHSDGVRTETFELVGSVGVYGGFIGTETDSGQRDWGANLTTLSGDIDENSTRDSYNSYNVVVGAGTSSTIIDGFTVTMGYGDHASIPQYQSGGGMYNGGCSPTVTNCIFDDNYALYGGGMSNNSSSPTVTDCDFTDNKALVWGGAVDNYNSSSPTITSCLFIDNEVTNDDSDNLGGAGIMCYSYCDATVVNCTFSQNTAPYGGGMLSMSNSDPTVTNSILWGNTATINYPSYAIDGGSTLSFTYSDVYLSTGVESGTGNKNTDPLFANAGNNDFHLKSAGGRWDPAASDWTDVGDDTTTSLCINTGDPCSVYSNEPTPNGGVINMGFYGNTSKASKTGYGSLKVDLTPGTAQWRVVGSGTWNDSGDSIDLISLGDTASYGVEFKDHLGYDTPSTISVYIYPEQETYRDVGYVAVVRYISPAGNNNDDGKLYGDAWQTIDYAIHAVDALGGGKLYFDAQNGTYTDSLQSSDFDDLDYMTNCWHFNGGVYISASESVFPSEYVSFTGAFSFDQ